MNNKKRNVESFAVDSCPSKISFFAVRTALDFFNPSISFPFNLNTSAICPSVIPKASNCSFLNVYFIH